MTRALFKRSSQTYYYSTKLFPKDIQEDVITLYAFVRTADDYVDSIPAQPEAFNLFVETYKKALHGHLTHNRIIQDFVVLQKRKAFKQAWVDSFLSAMRQDLSPRPAQTLKETEHYMHGSAEVIGLMMAQVMDLPKQSWPAAAILGKAMQYINFLRDIQEDNELGRQYIPQTILSKHGLSDVQKHTAYEHPEAFSAMMREEIGRYREWDARAREGFQYIPKRYRVPIQTAADMYAWTAMHLHNNPLVVFDKKIKPSKLRVLITGIKNAL